MKNLVRNILILIVVCLCAYLFSISLGKTYTYFLPQRGGGILTFPKNTTDFMIGLPLSYIFFLTLLFTAFGTKNKYWWIGILLIPAAIAEVYLDREHIYIPIALALLGWVIGFPIARFIKFINS